jgi:hypothetical protein
MKNQNSYEDRIDRIFAFSDKDIWEHRTLRTVFDPSSSEWSDTALSEKIDILRKIVESEENLSVLVLEYRERYLEQGRKDISDSVTQGLAEILEYTLKTKKHAEK